MVFLSKWVVFQGVQKILLISDIFFDSRYISGRIGLESTLQELEDFALVIERQIALCC